MALLFVIPSADSDSAEVLLAREIVSHLSARWPGCFFLCAGREPFAIGGDPDRYDWLGLPREGRTWGSPRLGEMMLGSLCGRFDIDAAIGIGSEAVALLSGLSGLPRLVLASEGDDLESPVPELKVMPLSRARGSDFTWLQEWILRHAPLEIMAGSLPGIRLDPGRLRTHAALRSAERIVLRWRGRPNPELRSLLSALSSLTTATITLQLLSSEYFDVPRKGLTHTPGEFLFQPAAWRQVTGFCWLILSAPVRVDVQVRTVSRKAWIHHTVRAANAGVAGYRTALRALLSRGRR